MLSGKEVVRTLCVLAALNWMGFAGPSAWADTTITALKPYTIDASSRIYRYWSTGSDAADITVVDTKAGFKVTHGETIISFTVYNNDFAANTTGMTVMIGLDDAAGTATQKFLAPIYGAATSDTADPAACSTQTCQGNRFKLQPGDAETAAWPQGDRVFSNRFYAARYTPGTYLTLAVKMDDLCLSAQDTGALLSGYCNLDKFNPKVLDGSTYVNQAVRLSLIFAVQPTFVATDLVSVEGTTQTKSLSLNFGQDQPRAACLTGEPPAGWYNPGDGQIRVDPSRFSFSTATGAPTPVEKLIVLARASDQAPVTDTQTFRDAGVNDVVGILDTTGEQQLKGFVNSTGAEAVANAGDAHSYQVRFMTRNAAGALGAFIADGTTACAISGVRTADISGILAGETKCFIATAAFGSHEAAPVILLRQFRDGVLRRLPFGESLVQFYYANSPPLANEVQSNPVLRLPTLTILAPAELVAWVLLRPLLLGALGILAMFLILTAPRMRSAVRE